MKFLITAILIVFGASAFAGSSTDPFEPNPNPPCTNPAPSPSPGYPSPTPTPNPYPTPEPVPVPPVTGYEYKCSYKIQIAGFRSFDTAAKANAFCEALKDHDNSKCEVVRRGPNGNRWWEASFDRNEVLTESSYVSHSDARKQIFIAISDLVEDNGYFTEYFAHIGQFQKCW